MSLVRITRDLIVNTAEIASAEMDCQNYMSGPCRTTLIITMNHGGQHRLEHRNYGYDPVDCYKIQEKLLNA